MYMDAVGTDLLEMQDNRILEKELKFLKEIFCRRHLVDTDSDGSEFDT
jgi:hypothetical protein